MKFTESVRSFHVPTDAFDVGLAAELAFGTDFARNARDFRCKRVELIDHDVDRIFEFEDLAAHLVR